MYLKLTNDDQFRTSTQQAKCKKNLWEETGMFINNTKLGSKHLPNEYKKVERLNESEQGTTVKALRFL